MTLLQVNEKVNLQWCIARRPVGNVVDEDFLLKESSIPECQAGQILLRTLYLNLAPVMRDYMLGESQAGEEPLNLGDVIHGRGVAQVIQSQHPEFSVGDVVQGQIGWQTFKVSSVTEQERISKVPDRGLSYGLSLGPLGMTGFSAYFGFLDRGAPIAGDVVVVSAAAGGVGSMVIQLAKLHECSVIGIAGGAIKCKAISAWCDHTIDYKNESVAQRLSDLLPNGLNIYFDNVGGETLSACLDHLAYGARVVLCGAISEYLSDKRDGPSNYTNLRAANASMNGFFVYNHAEHFNSAEKQMAEWIETGLFDPLVDLVEGFESMPKALARLYSHKNIGVVYCRIREIQKQ